jgi:hypothetical protein
MAMLKINGRYIAKLQWDRNEITANKKATKVA